MSKKTKLKEARAILVDLDLPSAQQNDRTALCLLALLNLTPAKSWSEVGSPMIGITPIMDWVREHYGKDYAPNTRETIRRQSMHQFVQAGISLYNPDKPDRPVNSPHAVYQIVESRVDAMALQEEDMREALRDGTGGSQSTARQRPGKPRKAHADRSQPWSASRPN